LLVDLDGQSREDIVKGLDLSRTVGWFTSRFPVVLNLEGARNLGDALKSIKEQLRQVPNGGIGYGLLRYLRKDPEIAEKLRSAPQPEVSFNYVGQFDQNLPASSQFKWERKSFGLDHSAQGSRHCLLEIIALVVGGRLRLNWRYHENVHQRRTIESLALRMVKALQSVIAHCQSTEAGGFTPSDFPKARLSQKDLDKFMARIAQADGRESK
jgi:non-ribosomal peptide synthase protein (TIGR01720 family)